MNYRHLYHAGNFADVIKHCILVKLLARLREKTSAFAVLDTHAGAGRYDLASAEAEKTGEYKHGIARLPQAIASEPLSTYQHIVARHAPFYPGSPLIARDMLRPQDRLILSELHPDTAAELKRLFKGDAQVAVHQQDGYVALNAFLPFREKRGLVLIDPPFENKQEFSHLATALQRAYAKFPTAIYAVWYPLKSPTGAEDFYAMLYETGITKLLACEFMLNNAAISSLAGCGMLFINPPWKLEQDITQLFSELTPLLGDASSTSRIWWIRGEG